MADKIKRRLLKSQTLESRLAERDPSGWGIGWPADWQDADLSDLQVEADSAWTPLALRFVSLLREQPLESCHTTSPKTVSLAEPDGRTIGGRECTPRVRLEQ